MFLDQYQIVSVGSNDNTIEFWDRDSYCVCKIRTMSLRVSGGESTLVGRELRKLNIVWWSDFRPLLEDCRLMHMLSFLNENRSFPNTPINIIYKNLMWIYEVWAIIFIIECLQ